MPTPIRRRFKVDTLLLDQTAPVAVLDVAALVTTNNIFAGDLWRSLAEDEWSAAVDQTLYPVEYKWLQAYFGQDRVPDRAVLIYWNQAATAPVITVEQALDAAVADGAAWYTLSYIGNSASDIAAQQDIAEYNQSFEEKTQTVLVSTDVNALASGAVTDIGYLLRTASINRASVIYEPAAQSTERPDAALLGRMLPTDAGAEQWDYKSLSFVTDSGLTSAQQSALRTKGYNFVETFKNTTFTHVFPSRTVTDREIRTQWGADWFDTNVQASLANYAFRTPLMAFDDDTFNDVEGLIKEWLARSLSRRIILDYEIDLPDPETIPASVRASGIANFNNVYTATLNSAIDGWKVSGNWSIGGI